ncbi:MAG: hypothetical protein NC339_06850 [Muribaculaceae bacterium]|nr:hypothetical protein [Muribaculaceae bacterium]
MNKQLSLTALCISAISLISTATTVEYQGTSYELSSNTLLLSEKPCDSPYAFTDPIKAFEAVNTASAGTVTLLVEPSVYWLDDPDDPTIRRNASNTNSAPFAFEIECDTLNIYGLSSNPEDVVFAVNRGQTQGALGNYTMFQFSGHSLRTENITFGNYCNVDLIYPRDPSKNRPKRRDAIVQAQLGICRNTDRLLAQNCRFISRLNLCPFVGARRSLYKDCYFECTDDALSGSGVYLDCSFTFHSGKPFYSTASTGAIFLNCDIHSLTDGTQYFTKIPGQMTVIDCRFTSDNNLQLQWTRDASDIRCYQSNNTLNGQPVTIDADRSSLWMDISDSPMLDAFKIKADGDWLYNTSNLLGGDDQWDPLGVADKVKEAQERDEKRYLNLPVTLRLSTDKRSLSPKSDTVVVKHSARLWGDYDTPDFTADCQWNAPNTLLLESNGGKGIKAISNNRFPQTVDASVSATTPYGLTGAALLNIDPFLLEAPKVKVSPSITSSRNELTLSYLLDREDDSDDDSYIIWYRSTRSDLADSVAVYHGRGVAAHRYPLSVADKGYYLSATVFPKYGDTYMGEPIVCQTEKQIQKVSPKDQKQLSTTFAEIPLRHTQPGLKGFWHFDVFKPIDTRRHDWTPSEDIGWYYGRGADAATGIGLVQTTKGARFSYTPALESYKGMDLSIVAEPSKRPGQGFGSATGQYMDICINFNPVALTGYALRIERKPDYDKAVTFTLVKYEDGIVTPLSESVPTSCYRTPCHINVAMKGSQLTASAYTEAPSVSNPAKGVLPSVELAAEVTPCQGTSIAVQHTGSAGASATLLRDLKVVWE